MSEKENLGGRPTTYKPEYVEAAREFFSDAHWDEKNKLWKFPSRVWFADHIGTPLSTVTSTRTKKEPMLGYRHSGYNCRQQ